jgi:regulator of sigma E protease
VLQIATLGEDFTRGVALVLETIPSGLVTLVAFIFMLALLVLVHELGHFLTAVWLRIKVEEFGFGYPPRALVLFEHRGVKYTLNWLPLGGFVRFGGEGQSIYGVGSLSAARPWRKIAVLAAGPLMNLLLAFLIFSSLFLIQGIPQRLPGAEVTTVFPGSPAAQAQFQPGVVLIELAGQPVGTDLSAIAAIAQSNAGHAIPVVVERAGQRTTLQVTPGPWQHNGEQRAAGFGFAYSPPMTVVPATLGSAFAEGFRYTFDVLARFIDGFRTMIMGLFGLVPAPGGGVAGVLGIARGTGEVIQSDGWFGFWRWTALISLNLFLVNLLPIPALDGSHILFSLLELARRGKKIPPEKEAMVHAFGFMMLMGLMVLITISDVANWIRGTPVLGGG